MQSLVESAVTKLELVLHTAAATPDEGSPGSPGGERPGMSAHELYGLCHGACQMVQHATFPPLIPLPLPPTQPSFIPPFGRPLAHFRPLPHVPRAVWCALLGTRGAHAYRVPLGVCNPMVCPMRVVRGHNHAAPTVTIHLHHTHRLSLAPRLTHPPTCNLMVCPMRVVRPRRRSTTRRCWLYFTSRRTRSTAFLRHYFGPFFSFSDLYVTPHLACDVSYSSFYYQDPCLLDFDRGSQSDVAADSHLNLLSFFASSS